MQLCAHICVLCVFCAKYGILVFEGLELRNIAITIITLVIVTAIMAATYSLGGLWAWSALFALIVIGHVIFRVRRGYWHR